MSNTTGESLLHRMYIERYNKQPQDIKNKLDNFRNHDYQLKVIKRKRPKLAEGDVFLLSPVENVYFYGKVIKVGIKTNNQDGFIEGKNTVFIYKCKTRELTLDDYSPNYDDLLIMPAIVDISYWNKGYFYTVGNVPLTDEEKSLDYGFYRSMVRDFFVTEEGTTLSYQPQLLGTYSIKTITGIAYYMWEELIMNSSLLSFQDGQDVDPEIFNRFNEAKEKDFVSLAKGKRKISVCFDIQHDKPFAIGQKMNEIRQEAYMNGYNWEAFFDYYLPKYASEVMGGKSDPEAGMYFYNYDLTPENEAKAEKFVGIIRSLIENDNELYRIVSEEEENIKWD